MIGFLVFQIKIIKLQHEDILVLDQAFTDGTQTSVNVESVGGNLIVQHYVAEAKEPDYVKMVSFSDLWLMKLVHVVIKVTWEMRLISVSDSECKFQNTVLVEHPNSIMKILSALALGGYFVRKHNEEETPLFAENLYKRTFKDNKFNWVKLEWN